jgi:hypothetical protein
MIRVALFDSHCGLQGYVELRALPVVGEDDYCCTPQGTLSLAGAAEVAKELELGAVEGWTQGFRWYRQV